MGAPDNLPLTASLQVTSELVEGLKQESGALQEVEDYIIDSQQMAVLVNNNLVDVKRRLALVEKWDEAFAAPIRQLEATRTALFGPAKQALAAAEAHCKNLLKGWTEKERQRVADEERARRDAERKAREEAERQAAAIEAKRKAEAEEARRKAEAAAVAERAARERAEAARQAGDTKAAAEADRVAKTQAAERAKREEEERQKNEAANRDAERIRLEAATAAAAAAPAVRAVEKLAGYSERKNWGAELADGVEAQQALEKIVCAIAGVEKLNGRTDLLSLMSLDMKAANRLAKAQEKNFNVPGLTARNNPTSASKG